MNDSIMKTYRDGDLIKIGYWYSEREPYLPMPIATDVKIDMLLVNYLKSAEIVYSNRGGSPCRLCDNRFNGSRGLSDGVYQWPQGLAHYVEDHGVKLEPGFIAHVHAMVGDEELIEELA